MLDNNRKIYSGKVVSTVLFGVSVIVVTQHRCRISRSLHVHKDVSQNKMHFAECAYNTFLIQRKTVEPLF